MKIGCDACGQAEAAVLCCADEAALCRRCDAAVHSANRLAGKHQRLELLATSPHGHNGGGGGGGGGGGSHPACDICQEKTGYFFCVEDRALLCRSCDVAVHTATNHVTAHRRFLITGVRIGAVKDLTPGSNVAAVSPSSSSANGSNSVPSSSNHTAADHPRSAAPPGMAGEDYDFGQPQEQEQQQWPWSDIFADDDGGGGGAGMDQHQQCYPGFSEPGSSSLTG